MSSLVEKKADEESELKIHLRDEDFGRLAKEMVNFMAERMRAMAVESGAVSPVEAQERDLCQGCVISTINNAALEAGRQELITPTGFIELAKVLSDDARAILIQSLVGSAIEPAPLKKEMH